MLSLKFNLGQFHEKEILLQNIYETILQKSHAILVLLVKWLQRCLDFYHSDRVLELKTLFQIYFNFQVPIEENLLLREMPMLLLSAKRRWGSRVGGGMHGHEHPIAIIPFIASTILFHVEKQCI